jgi:hypothetical protein
MSQLLGAWLDMEQAHLKDVDGRLVDGAHDCAAGVDRVAHCTVQHWP